MKHSFILPLTFMVKAVPMVPAVLAQAAIKPPQLKQKGDDSYLQDRNLKEIADSHPVLSRRRRLYSDNDTDVAAKGGRLGVD